MPRKLTKAETIASRTPEEVVRDYKKYGINGLRKDVQTLRTSYKRRIGSFKRQDLVSYAQIAFERQIPNSKPVQLTKMNYNQLLVELYRYSDFFNSETSNAQGIKRVNREQDERIFGKTKGGKVRRRMNNEQRKLYWKAYDEFKVQNKSTFGTVYSSEFVQQFLGSVVPSLPEYKKSIGDFTDTELAVLLEKVAEDLAQRKAEEGIVDVPNQFTGRRDDFSF